MVGNTWFLHSWHKFTWSFPMRLLLITAGNQDPPMDAHLCTSITVPMLIFKSLPVFYWSFQLYLLTQASIMSVAMSLSLCSKWCANSGSGQWRSKTNICRASSFQKRSSDVAEPLLWKTKQNKIPKKQKINVQMSLSFAMELYRRIGFPYQPIILLHFI